MKNFSFLRFAVIFAFLGILFSSCTKDSLSKPASLPSFSKHHTNDPGPGLTTGTIQAIISANGAVRTSLVITCNDDGTQYPEAFADDSGVVIVTDLPAGNYTVVAHAYMPTDGGSDYATDINDVTITFNDITVVADQITDLGKIIFN